MTSANLLWPPQWCQTCSLDDPSPTYVWSSTAEEHWICGWVFEVIGREPTSHSLPLMAFLYINPPARMQNTNEVNSQSEKGAGTASSPGVCKLSHLLVSEIYWLAFQKQFICQYWKRVKFFSSRCESFALGVNEVRWTTSVVRCKCWKIGT